MDGVVNVEYTRDMLDCKRFYHSSFIINPWFAYRIFIHDSHNDDSLLNPKTTFHFISDRYICPFFGDGCGMVMIWHAIVPSGDSISKFPDMEYQPR